MSESSARYRFGDSARAGVLLGMGFRQAAPIMAGVLWLTLWLMAQLPLIGLSGLGVGVIVAFGRWRRAPLYEVAVPGLRILAAKWRRRKQWHRVNLLASGPGLEGDVPRALRGMDLVEREISWAAPVRIGVVVDRSAGTVSLLIPVVGERFPVAGPGEQDQLVAAWGAALAPFARARCPVSRVTWQEWSHPCGLDDHRDFLTGLRPSSQHVDAIADYECLLVEHEPFTTAHEVIVTVTVERRRLRSRGGHLDTAIDVLAEEARQFAARLTAAGFIVDQPMNVHAVAFATRCRSDPARLSQLGSLSRSLAAAAGHGAPEWGPMCVEDDWFQCRVDGSMHRSFRVAAWPMLPVGADWLAPLLTVEGATRTMTVVLEPVPLGAAASDANRHLTSIEADQQQKEQHGFRLTARERRRHADVESRERELAEGHPMFRHVGIVTVSASTLHDLDDACQIVEQAAAQSLIDLRPLAARQAEGWVASLPLGRSVRSGPSR